MYVFNIYNMEVGCSIAQILKSHATTAQKEKIFNDDSNKMIG